MQENTKIFRNAAFLLVVITSLPAASTEVQGTSNSSSGDHFILNKDLYYVYPVSQAAVAPKTPRCAYSKTAISAREIGDQQVIIYFHEVSPPQISDTCAEDAPPVIVGSDYVINRTEWDKLDAKVTGLTFGTLVVPFKFRLGAEKKLVSSATIAPYMGWRWSRAQFYGLDIRPIVSAGLGIVPVTDAATNKTETKAAFSTAIGLTLHTVKDAGFTAGVVFGKDFLGKGDKGTDPSVDKMWLSVWVGLAK